MSHEVWKAIPRFSGSHLASDLGRIKSVDRVIEAKNGSKWHTPGKLMTKHVQSNGYATVTISQGGRYQPYLVHRLVLEAFVGPCPAGMQVRHLNGDRIDNRLDNLVWGTAIENQADRRSHGTACSGEKHPAAKLSASEVREIRRLWAFGIRPAALADRFGVSRAAITDITSHRSWKEAV